MALVAWATGAGELVVNFDDGTSSTIEPQNGIPSRGGRGKQVPMRPGQTFSVKVPDPPFHGWRVYSTLVSSAGGPAVMVECKGCHRTGLVREFDDALWRRAFHAPSAPFDLPAGYLVTGVEGE